MKRISILITNEQYRLLTEESKLHELSMSEQIRTAISILFNESSISSQKLSMIFNKEFQTKRPENEMS